MKILLFPSALIFGVFLAFLAGSFLSQRKRKKEEILREFTTYHYFADTLYSNLITFLVDEKETLCQEDCLPRIRTIEEVIREMKLPRDSPDQISHEFIESVQSWKRPRSESHRGPLKALHRIIFESMSCTGKERKDFVDKIMNYLKSEAYFFETLHSRPWPQRYKRIFRNLAAHRACEILHYVGSREMNNKYISCFITELSPPYLMYGDFLF